MPTSMDPFEFAAFVMSTRGTCVRLVIIGEFLELWLTVNLRGFFRVQGRMLFRYMPRCCPPGTLTFMRDALGTGVKTWIDLEVSESRTLLRRPATPPMCLFLFTLTPNAAMRGLVA